MATRSTIGILNQDGTVDGVYCHNDGYLSHNGRVLLNHYRGVTKVRRLIRMGGISSLNPEIGVKHPFDWRSEMYRSGKSFDEIEASPLSSMVTAYRRDRGDRNWMSHSKRYQDVAEFYADSQQYCYLYREGAWFLVGENGMEALTPEMVTRQED